MNSISKFKTGLVIIVFLQTLNFVSQAQDFITQWNLATAGSGTTQLSFGTATSGIVNYTWQEISPGSATGSGSWSGSPLTITGLPIGATIRLQIEPTNFQRIVINNGNDRNRLTQVENWGSTAWTSMQNVFSGCSNLQVTAADVPNLSGVTNMSQMFGFCTNLNSPGNINAWNTATVTDMSSMFSGGSAFNQNIGSWNTSAVTTMQNMFFQASAFNQDIGAWNTSAVTDISRMFQGASAFNQNIGSWNTAAVNTMAFMFASASTFNGNIDSWNTATATDMAGMFAQASSFNQNTGSWNTAAVTNMSNMFSGAIAFNQNIGAWNTAAVTNMSNMFAETNLFNQNIGAWNTGAVTNMRSMFYQASAFNQNIGTWNVSGVTNMSDMFYLAIAFNQNIGAWDVGAVTNMEGMFTETNAFNQNIGSWNTGAVTSMQNMFNRATAFNQNLGAWTLLPGIDLRNMFDDSGMNCNNYSATLIEWSANPSTPTGRTLGANGRQFGTNAVAARTNLLTTKGWTINGDTPSSAVCGSVAIPTITNFNPKSGAIGSTVIITGTNFSTTPANNIVYLGAARATVSAASATSLTVTVPVGATFEPITATVAGLTAYSTHRFVVTHSGGNISLNNKVCFTVGSNPREVAIADLNNDRHLDLIVSRTDVATAVLLFGNGNGTFQSPISITTGSGGALTVGDFSGDGVLDLAFANYSSFANATTSILINNGSGVFPTTDTYFLSNPPIGIGSGAVYITDADFNLDGKVDLVSAIDNIPGSLSVLLNNDTSFNPKVEYPTNDNYPYSVTAADLNNDKYPDWIIGNFFSNTAKVFINNGAGGVASEATYTTASGTHEVEVADLNKDNHLDLIAINATANTISVLLNDGTGSFSAKTDYAAGANYQPDVELADIDGDGNLDAVTGASGNVIFIMKGDGTGGFGSPQSFGVGTTPFGIAIGDLDEDGEPDIVAANFSEGTLCLLLSKPIAPPVIETLPLLTVIEGQVTLDLIPLITTSSTLDRASLQVVSQPISGATAFITNGVLFLNYSGIPFVGKDSLTIRACDTSGNCTDQIFEVTVVGDITIYNALSPNGDGKNEILYLEYIDVLPDTQKNKVTIYNRWGDVVFATENYDNQSNVFKGLNKNGNELPTGTYFYKIEFQNRDALTGFISLKR